jgi:hypothetical protein
MRRIVFLIAFIRKKLPVQSIPTSTKSRRKFYTQVGHRSFYTAWTRSGLRARISSDTALVLLFAETFCRWEQVMSDTPGLAKPAKPSAKTLLSLSIDMAGSTEAKTRMLAIAVDDDWRHHLYTQLYRDFLRAEDAFYKTLFADSSVYHGSRIDWRRLFVVKGIGDEIWILYEIDPANGPHIQAIAARFLDASLVLLQTSVHWSATENDHGPAFDPTKELSERHDSMELAYKVHVDLVSDALEIANIRAEAFRSQVTAYLGSTAFGADEALLASRLNGGYFEVQGSKIFQVFRTDYIGHEIDRFFRTSKAAVPNAITMGETLFDRLDLRTRLYAHPGLFSAAIKYDRDISKPGGAFGYWHDLLFVQSELAASELKGIGYSYRIYTFTTRPMLNGLWHRACDRGDKLVQPTIERFPIELRDKLKTVEERDWDENES